MISLKALTSIKVINQIIGDIDQRIKKVNQLNIPYNSEINIIIQLERDKELISDFYETKKNGEINENNIFIQYVQSNEKNKVKTVLRYYPEYANAICSLLSQWPFCPIKDTALIVASNNGHTEIVEMLLKAGANVDARNKYGYTALIEASWGSHVDIVRMLLKAGAHVNAENHFGYTALIEASINGNTTDIVEMLLKAGADVNVRDITGQTALTSAIRKDHIGKIELLRQAGAEE